MVVVRRTPCPTRSISTSWQPSTSISSREGSSLQHLKILINIRMLVSSTCSTSPALPCPWVMALANLSFHSLTKYPSSPHPTFFLLILLPISLLLLIFHLLTSSHLPTSSHPTTLPAMLLARTSPWTCPWSKLPLLSTNLLPVQPSQPRRAVTPLLQPIPPIHLPLPTTGL